MPNNTNLTRPPRRWATPQDAAAHAQISLKTLRRWIADGRLTGYRAGPRLLRVDLNELDDLLRPIPTAAAS